MKIKFPKASETILAVVIFLVTISFTIGTYYNHDIIGGMLALELSDTMYLPTLYKDLFIEGGSYSDWYLAPAPYFFPDMFQYFIASYLSDGFYTANIIFIVMQLLTLSLSSFLLYKSIYKTEIALLFSSFLITVFYMVPTSVSTLLIKGNWHYGVTLSGVFLIALLMHGINKNYNVTSFTLISIVTAFTVASDKLILLQFIAPILLSMTLMSIYGIIEIKKFVYTSIILLSSVIFGLLLTKVLILNETAYPIHYSLNHIAENYVMLSHRFKQYFVSNSALAIVNVLIVIYAFKVVWRVIFCKAFELNKTVIFACMFYVSMVVLTILVLLLSDLEMANRYLIPVFMLPLIMFPIILSAKTEVVGESTARNSIILFGVLTFVCSVGWSASKLSDFRYKDEYYPKYIECIDDFFEGKKVNYGIGNYWVSKRFSMLNKSGYKVVNTNRNLNPIHRISTSGWDQEKYDFMVFNKRWKNNPKLSLIQERNINPKFIKKTCNFVDVYYFEDGFKLK